MDKLISKKRGALNGFLLWLLMFFITTILLILLSDPLGGLIFIGIIFPTTPLLFIVAGYYCWYNTKRRGIFLVVNFAVTLPLCIFLSFGIYEDKLDKNNWHSSYFNIKSNYNVEKNLDGCYQQFKIENSAQRKRPVNFYLECDYKEIPVVMGNTISNREKGIAGNARKYDCVCKSTRPLFYW